MEIYQGRPETNEGRLQKEIAVYDLLDELQISYERVDHPVLMTIADCAEVDQTLHITICKNLFLCNHQKTDFYLLMMPGEKKFVTKDVCKKIPSPRLSFADESYMEEFLNITPGSVSIMGLMNDKDNAVRLLVDEDLLKEEWIGCHPCVNTSSIRMKTKDMFDTVMKAMHHEMTVVKLTGEENK